MTTVFDSELTITQVKRFTSFRIHNINIRVNEPAIIDVFLEGQDSQFEQILIPVEVYTMWQYDISQIESYCKTYLQNKYTLNPSV